MKTFSLVCAVSAAALMASACDQPQQTTTLPADDMAATDTMTPMDGVGTTGAGTALGMNTAQLESANVVSADGTKLGEVDRVVTDANGNVTGMVVSLEGAGDRRVMVQTDQVTARGNDVQTTMTAEQLAALPDAPAM